MLSSLLFPVFIVKSQIVHALSEVIVIISFLTILQTLIEVKEENLWLQGVNSQNKTLTHEEDKPTSFQTVKPYAMKPCTRELRRFPSLYSISEPCCLMPLELQFQKFKYAKCHIAWTFREQ